MVGPTHPLRLAWLWRYQRTLFEWIHGDANMRGEASELTELLPNLVPANVPHVLEGEQSELRFLEPLDLNWALWAALRT